MHCLQSILAACPDGRITDPGRFSAGDEPVGLRPTREVGRWTWARVESLALSNDSVTEVWNGRWIRWNRDDEPYEGEDGGDSQEEEGHAESMDFVYRRRAVPTGRRRR